MAVNLSIWVEGTYILPPGNLFIFTVYEKMIWEDTKQMKSKDIYLWEENKCQEFENPWEN